MAGPGNDRFGGDGCAAHAVVGLAAAGQPQRKRKLSCESSDGSATALQDAKPNSNSSTTVRARRVPTGGKAKRKRKTKWNVEPGLSVVRHAIYLYRNGEANSVEVERRLGVPARTLRRYVQESLDPTNEQFYLEETVLERRGRQVQEVSERYGNYSEESFVVASQYMPPLAAARGMTAHAPTAAAETAALTIAPPSLDRNLSLSDLPSDLTSPGAATAPFVDFDFNFDSIDLNEALIEMSALDAIMDGAAGGGGGATATTNPADALAFVNSAVDDMDLSSSTPWHTSDSFEILGVPSLS